ncbi:MAG: ATP-binding protein [Ginsengibacter sp.]
MKKYLLLFALLFLLSGLKAQYKVRFIVKEKTALHHDSIYITGTFNNWDSTANKNYLMQPHGENEKSITLNLKPGMIGYKFNRGSWFTVEKLYNGNEVTDRLFTINKDTTFIDSVVSWRDEMFSDKKYALAQQNQDTTKVSILAGIAANYAFISEYYNSDSALYFAQQALDIIQKIKSSNKYQLSSTKAYSDNLMYVQEIIASLLHSLGNYPKALEIRLENLGLAEEQNDKSTLLWAISNLTNDYVSMKDYRHVLSYGKVMDSILSKLKNDSKDFAFWSFQTNSITANAFYKLQLLDSALYYAKKVDFSFGNSFDFPFYASTNNLLLANIYSVKDDNDSAFYHYRAAIPFFARIGAFGLGLSYEGLARLFQKQGNLDSALYYARMSIGFFQNNKNTVKSWGENSNTFIADISPLLAEIYKANGQPDSAYKYLLLSVNLKDSLYNTDKERQFQTLTFNETSRRLQLEQQKKEAQQQYNTKIKMYGLLSIIAGILIVAFFLYRNNKQKQKANKVLEATLGNLKSTQGQLIQSEKMASLGELTAGIAHEIQNPLNFVNNFSEINKELIEELKGEKAKLNTEEIDQFLDDIAANEEKINHHGKRADAIVKGMLQHSRTSTGVKEPTDINALCDEYLRLSYHGLRAKDKSFNAELKTESDKSIGKIDIIPQDIGRVLLNLYNNAFYAVNEKDLNSLLTTHNSQLTINYHPTVSVTTKKSGNHVMIAVSDNGNGIPQNIIDKIFQPFFTTKPTGEGTGLGLSLSYDIIKAHGGEIKVESKEGQGTEFAIHLPLN